MLTFKDNNLCKFMTEQEMREKAPFIFSKEKTNPATSDKYKFADTETIIKDMAKLGWGVTECKQQRANKRSKIRSFHTVAFQNPTISKKGDDGEVEVYPRIIISNSHDGFHSFKFMCGLFRLVCSNGLVIADEQFSKFSIRHVGYTFDELQRIVAEAVKIVEEKMEVITKMKEITLTDEQKDEFATKAVAIRKGDENVKLTAKEKETILEPVRDEDEGNSLWSVFNVLQEKVIKGDFTLGKTKTGKARKARPITGVAKDIEVNQALFRAATEYLQAA